MANAAVDSDVKSGGITRREFLYYIWGASLALFTAEFTGLLIWFLIPRFREGEFGGKFRISVDDVPALNDAPVSRPDGRFWLVNLDSSQPNERMYMASDENAPIAGVAAIYKVCTHLGCIYTWTVANQRFECPCHGSKYRLDGRRIESPAPRDLDRFLLEALDENGQVLAASELVNDFYQPLVLPPGTAFISIDTGARKQGLTETLLCEFNNSCP